MCVVASEPLPIDVRVGVVELCREHELLADQCEVSVPDVPRGLLEHVRLLWGRRPRRQVALEAGPAGAWMGERVRAIGTSSDFEVWSRSPRWKGEVATGPFHY